ncbi:MAG: flagellar filament capping protein FliD [Thauera sp.]|uniref:flagellar filament capping protein FliD n=1 Tax=Thauera sp. TaxID=1905334 RepID=UPI002616D74F|nr:flagellar filament capping protein FliD [Thauera sp.]MCP5224905.1 flagellar filament capping protein FliD [Thauera sp.]
MALSASGLGSGLDINSLVSQLMAVERQPLTAMARKEASFQAKLSAFGQIKGSLSALQTAANALNDAAKFSATKATVGSDAGFTASTASGAAAGSYSVQVEQLAKVQRVATGASTSFTPTAGTAEAPTTVSITFGKMDGGSFVPGEAGAKSIDFTGSTIEELRDAINKGDLGVTASVIDNGTAKQLVVTGKKTGAEQAFQIGGTAGLAYDPSVAIDPENPTVPAGSNTSYVLQASQDARINVDGITVTRGSNTISDVLEGVTLTLTKETTAAASLSVAEDFGGARSAIDAFVKAHNDTQTTLKNLTNYNAETRTAATLTGDSSARSIQSQVRNLVGGALSGLGDTTRLADIGITFDKDGKLTVDSSKLDAALKDPNRDVAAFFTGSGDTKGLAATVSDGLKNFIDTGGLLAGRTEGLNASIKMIGKQREAFEARLESVQKRYQAQFTALDSTIASMTQTSNYLTQQLASLSSFA